MNLASGHCEMCGHNVANRQKAHIIAEGPKTGANLVLLCPSCHVMFDTHLKPKFAKALTEYGVSNIPKSWEKSIYLQAAEASQRVRNKKR
jgi:hypothetical protein